MIRVSLRVHDWSVLLRSEDDEFPALLRRMLPSCFSDASPASREILIDYRHLERREPLPPPSIHDIRPRIFREIDYPSGLIRIRIQAGVQLTNNWIYHACFLSPLALLIRRYGCTLVHGAVVAKDGEGILLMGEKGAGKSTLSASFLLSGYEYFSDEHALLQRNAAGVWAVGFPNRIGLTPASATNFPALRQSLEWDRHRKKFYLDPTLVPSGALGNTCQITRVVFPFFVKGSAFSSQRLSSHVLFSRLVQDEYFRLDSRNAHEKRLSDIHWRLFEALAQSTEGLRVTFGERDVHEFPACLKRLRPAR